MKQLYYFFYLIIILFFISCQSENIESEKSNQEHFEKEIIEEKIAIDTIQIVEKLSKLEENIIELGLINVLSLDSSFVIDLRYASENNFTGKVLYDSLKNIYLQKDVAEKLVKAHQILKKNYPDYRFILFDGLRPKSIQQQLWDNLEMPDHQKLKYVSNPQRGSLHNYGAAIDLSIYDIENNKELDMGTPYDYFGVLAYPARENEMLEKGLLSETQLANRLVLRKVMTSVGFFTITSEWWHFNAHSLATAKEKYKVLE
jgi:zinc D-Ala-D-Ala dipeptidase